MKKIFLCLIFIVLFQESFSEIIKSRVKEKYSEIYLKNVIILVSGTERMVKTDNKGNFELDLKSGESVKIITKDYKIKEITFEEIQDEIELEKEGVLYADEILVSRRYKTGKMQKEVSKIELTGEEIKSIPQNIFSDISTGLNSLPGINKTSEFSSLMYIRGSEPYDLLYSLNGVPVSNPYKWGGRTSLINQNLVKTINLYTGAMPAKNTQAMAGSLELEYEDGNKDEFEGEVNLGAETTLKLSGPIENGTYFFGFRRTFYDYFLNSQDGITKAPYFTDAYLSVTQNIGLKNKLRVWGIFSNEGMDVLFSSVNDVDDYAKDGDKFKYDAQKTFLTLEYNRLLTDSSYLKLTYSNHNDKQNINELTSPTETGKLDFEQGSNDYMLEYGLDYGDNKLKIGAYTTRWDAQGTIDFNTLQKVKLENGEYAYLWLEVNQTMEKEKLDLTNYYIENDFNIGRLTLTPGLNYAKNSFYKDEAALDYRLRGNYELATKTNLKFGFGQHSQFLMEKLVVDDSPELKEATTDHYVIGIEKEIEDNYRLRIETYYKDIDNYYVQALQKPDSEDYSYLYDNSGMGISKGIEFYIQKKNLEKSKLDGWISYTYAITKYKMPIEGERDNWYYPEQDQRHTINVTSNYYMWKNEKSEFKIGSKIDFYTGRSYQDFEVIQVEVEDKNDLSKTEKIYVESSIPNKFKRMPIYFRCDLSIEYTKKSKWEKTYFIQLMNLTNHENVEGYTVAPYSSAPKIDKELGFGFTPMFGFKMKF